MRAPLQIAATARIAALGTAIWLLACGGGVPLTFEQPPLNDHNRALYARTNLQKARALRAILERAPQDASAAYRFGLHRDLGQAELVLGREAEAIAELEAEKTGSKKRSSSGWPTSADGGCRWRS